MAGKKEYEARTEELLTPIVEANGCRVYDVEYVKEGSDYYLRAYIDKDGGVTIDDCETVSRALNDILDAEDYIADPYIFEVSSPGLGRTLKKDRHLRYSIGDEVEIKLFEAEDGTKEFAGILKTFDDTTLTIENEQGEKVFERKKIATVKLALDF